uniref:Uncharacterized protein n=1 Tax=Corethron hystrix TaxID=216773 RepID=A0A6U5MKB2_9STRA|mmetsp:Transcript_9590/g.21293  ORF Transcript_9590/g.21293 Transcript_9590/m.21293 type:complete len:424 (+) Transcript_9590:2156-3427(+)
MPTSIRSRRRIRRPLISLCLVGLNFSLRNDDGVVMFNCASAFVIRKLNKFPLERHTDFISLRFYVNDQHGQRSQDIPDFNVTNICVDADDNRKGLLVNRPLHRWRFRKLEDAEDCNSTSTDRSNKPQSIEGTNLKKNERRPFLKMMRGVGTSVPVEKIGPLNEIPQHSSVENSFVDRPDDSFEKERSTGNVDDGRKKSFPSSNMNEFRKRNERKLKFSASHSSNRRIVLKPETQDLFKKYMTQSPEKYSLKSSCNGNNKKTIQSRRWVVRRLDEHEAGMYGTNCNIDRWSSNAGLGIELPDYEGSFFRIAVPLMPLVGLALTPVVDLEVTAPRSSLNPLVPKKDEIKIRSCKVALLSTDEEIHQAMKNKKPLPRHITKAVKSIGDDMIFDVAKTIQKLLQPHLEFSGSVTWRVNDYHGKFDFN